MFTIYQKNIGGRISQRYFRKWENAKSALLNELDGLKGCGWTVTGRTDKMNEAKGFYEYCTEGRTNEGEPFFLALIESCFED